MVANDRIVIQSDYDLFWINSLIFSKTTPMMIIIIEIIFSMLTGSLKYAIPITETNKIPIPAHIAYAKLKSKCFKANIKTLKEMPQKTKVKIEAYKLVKPFDNFIQVDPASSVKIPMARRNQRI